MHRIAPSRSHNPTPRAQLAKEVVLQPTASLRPFPGNPRKHPQAQISRLMRVIANGWTNPILIDETNTILCGHGRLEAAKRLGLDRVPTLTVTGLSAAAKRALVISDNKLGEQAVWDFDLLENHLRELIDLDFDVELTGFSTGEVDILLDGTPTKKEVNDPDDDLDDSGLSGPAVSIAGDLWQLGPHRLYCGSALEARSYEVLMGGEPAQMVVTDPPYNVKISGHVRGRGCKHHREFAMASGEMSDAEFVSFLERAMSRAVAASTDGSIHYWFIDWRHLYDLQRAARPLYSEFKNLLVWNKTNAGQGAFYRSKHELVAVFKNDTAPHTNNFGLGEGGRYRTNVLDYPGVNSLVANRKEEMDAHPTVKPVALIADLMRDCSRRNGIVLDSFAGSGTVLLAAQRTGRIARAIEIDPAYVDLAIRRWERATGETARHESGKTFAELSHERCSSDDKSISMIQRGAVR
ncbi:MAG TPA: DNA methyltransferase [Rhizomicrobium sp.]|jgi:DNA modification methylase|nr:DNA methyltransferase [Rhizomicrobium sp.]